MNSSEIWTLFSTPTSPKNLIEFRKNYKKLSIKFHPDKLQNSKTQNLDNSTPTMEIINTLKQWLELRIKATSTAPDYNLNTQEFTNFINKLITYESYVKKLPNSTNFWQTAAQNLEDFDKILAKISPKLEPKFVNVPFKKTNFNSNPAQNWSNFNQFFDKNGQQNQKSPHKTPPFSSQSNQFSSQTGEKQSKNEKNDYKTTNFDAVFAHFDQEFNKITPQNRQFYGTSDLFETKTEMFCAKNTPKTSKNNQKHHKKSENNTIWNENGGVLCGDFEQKSPKNSNNHPKTNHFSNQSGTQNSSNQSYKHPFFNNMSDKFNKKFNNQPTHNTNDLNSAREIDKHHLADNLTTHTTNNQCVICDEIRSKLHAAHYDTNNSDELNNVTNSSQNLNCTHCQEYLNHFNTRVETTQNSEESQFSQDENNTTSSIDSDYISGVGDVLNKTVGRLFDKPLKKIKNIFKKK